MDDSDRLYQITETGKTERMMIRSVLIGVLGFIGIVLITGYGCNKDDDAWRTHTAQAEVDKLRLTNEVERTKLETEKSRLDLERAIIESAPKVGKE